MRSEAGPAKRTQRISAQNFSLDSADKIVKSMLGERRASDSIIETRSGGPATNFLTRGFASAVHTSQRQGEVETHAPITTPQSYFSSQLQPMANPLLTRLNSGHAQPPQYSTWSNVAPLETQHAGRWESSQSDPLRPQMTASAYQSREWASGSREQWQTGCYAQPITTGQWQSRYYDQPTSLSWSMPRQDPPTALPAWGNTRPVTPVYSPWAGSQVMSGSYHQAPSPFDQSSYKPVAPFYSSNIYYTQQAAPQSPYSQPQNNENYPGGVRSSGSSPVNGHFHQQHRQESSYQPLQVSPQHSPVSALNNSRVATPGALNPQQREPGPEVPQHTLSSYLKNIFAIQETDEERFSSKSNSEHKPLAAYFTPGEPGSPSSVLQPATASIVLNTRPEILLDPPSAPVLPEASFSYKNVTEAASSFNPRSSAVIEEVRRANSAQPRPERSSMRKSTSKKPKKRVDFNEEHELVDVPKYIKKNPPPQPVASQVQQTTYRPSPVQAYTSQSPSASYATPTAQWHTPISPYASAGGRPVYAAQSATPSTTYSYVRR